MTDESAAVPVPKMVSLGVMCGDEHSGAPLLRCLRSVFERKSGCPVDEVVIGFNGQDKEQLWATVRALGYQCPPEPTKLVDNVYEPLPPLTFRRPPLKVVTFEWPGRFDAARNQYWPHLSGEWLLSMDADDVLADAGTEAGLAAIQNVERDYGLTPTSGPSAAPVTLQNWLASLPNIINVIYLGYDYQLDENGYVVVRQKSKRLVKRSLGHIWYSPDESGIHEVLTTVGAVPESAISNLGLLLQHFPSQAEAERAKRNADIVAKLTTRDIPTDARHAYDTANAQVHLGQLNQAEQSLRIAIQSASNDLDRYTYRLAYCSLKLTQGDAAAALEQAFAAVGVSPDFQEAYFIASEALYRMGKWSSVIEWYERGLSKSPVLLSRDQPLMRFIQPRGQAADAYLNLSKPREGMKLAQECIERYPKSPLAQWVHARAKQQLEAETLGTALLDAAEILIEGAPQFAHMLLRQIPRYAVTRGLDKALRTRALRERVDVAFDDDLGHEPFSLDGEWSPSQRIELEDALLRARQDDLQLLKYEQRGPKRAYVKARDPDGSRIAFYSPSAVETWVPQHIEVHGLGGSESSLAYLARELGKLGHTVEVYTPSGAGLSLWSGEHRGTEFAVVQKNLTSMQEIENADLVVTCRAPYLAREMRDMWGAAANRVWCWHQDNGYGNPWLWSRDVANMQQHLHVSDWTRGGLIAEAEKAGGSASAVTAAQHHVLGNGVPLECAEGWDVVPRNPHRVIYASDPSRGLEKLLDVWPDVRAAIPDAELLIYSGFRVMAALKQDAPGLPFAKRIEAIRTRCIELMPQGVVFVGWQPQPMVLAAMKTASVYVYPGGPMPEGFGVSLVQAMACGCDVIFPAAGALPDVLAPLRPSETIDADLIVRRLLNEAGEGERRARSAAAIERHGWPTVAKRFLELVSV